MFDARRQPAPAPDQPAATAPTQEPSASAAPGVAPPGQPAAPVVFTSPVGPGFARRSNAARTARHRARAIARRDSAGAANWRGARSRPAKPADASAAAAQALADHVLVQGGEPPARPNRADDFTYRAADAPGPVAH